MQLSLLITFFGCLIFLKLFIYISPNIGLVDRPSDRKIHLGNIPTVGGLAIFLSVLIGFLALESDINQFKNILIALLIFVAVGLIDDRGGLSAGIRVVFHTFGIIFLLNDGIVIENLGKIFEEIPVHKNLRK